MPSSQGGFRLFRLAGIDVFLHWSWFVVAAYELQGRGGYTSQAFNVVEYLGLFVIVLLHEFGHALACRQVGGTANQIVLWPFGGVAFVNPPQRPGATLWSLAAGPLVNVALVVPLLGLRAMSHALDLSHSAPDAARLIANLVFINFGLLVFNLLPVYPLDGGQILRSLLWFVIGRARSLTAASLIGLAGTAGLAWLAVLYASPWTGFVVVFVGMNCWRGFQQARTLSRMAQLPRHVGFACPSCGIAPPIGAAWVCSNCRARFDTFESHGTCPHCGSQFPMTVCFDCGARRPLSEWEGTAPSSQP